MTYRSPRRAAVWQDLLSAAEAPASCAGSSDARPRRNVDFVKYLTTGYALLLERGSTRQAQARSPAVARKIAEAACGGVFENCRQSRWHLENKNLWPWPQLRKAWTWPRPRCCPQTHRWKRLCEHDDGAVCVIAIRELWSRSHSRDRTFGRALKAGGLTSTAIWTPLSSSWKVFIVENPCKFLSSDLKSLITTLDLGARDSVSASVLVLRLRSPRPRPRRFRLRRSRRGLSSISMACRGQKSLASEGVVLAHVA